MCFSCVCNRLYEFLAQFKMCVGLLNSFYWEHYAEKVKILTSVNEK